MPYDELVPGFVGREDELASLTRAIAAAVDGVPAVFVVSGDAGIGKSALLAEVAARGDVPRFVGRCVPMGGDAMPLAPLSELIRVVRRRSPELFASPTLAPLTAWPNPSDASVGAVFEAVLELFGRLAAGGPVLLLLEDMHWADTVTWDLFDFLARNLSDEAVVLVGTCRADEVGRDPQRRRRLAEIARLPIVHRMHLAGLSRADVADRISALLGRPPSSDLVDRVVARGGGNPFFTQELVAADRLGLAIPEALSDLIAADLEGFDDEGRWVLGAIAAVGHATDHGLLAEIAELALPTLEAALRQAVDARLLLVDGDRYRFRHALIGEVAYAQLLPSQRSRLHGRIAARLSIQSDDVLRRPDRAGEFAFHLDRAGDAPAAFVARLAAADAAEVLAPATAFGHLERALALWDAAGASVAADRSTRLWQAAELASTTVSNHRAIELAREAMAIGPPVQGAAWAHERLGRYLWAVGQLDASAAEFDAAAALLEGSGPGAGAAATYAGLAQAALMRGRNDDAHAYVQRVFELALDPTLHPAAWVMATRVEGVVRSQQGDPDAGVDLCRQAVAQAPTANARVFAVAYLGSLLIDAGRHDEAATEMLDAIAEAHLTGTDASFGPFLAGVASDALVRSGRWSQAQVVLDRYDPSDALPVGAVRLAAAGLLLAGRRGDLVGVEGWLAVVAPLPVDPWQQMQLDHSLCDAYVACGAWALAGEVARRARATSMGELAQWRSRFALLATIARVESTLDAVARREPVDVHDVRAALRTEPSGTAPDASVLPAPMAAERAHREAEISRLTAPDPAVWERAADLWALVGDGYWVAVARFHQAEAAFELGELTAASTALQLAHAAAVELGAHRLAAEIGALSRRTRLSVEAPRATVLAAASIDRLGLTTREAEVLGLVAAGQTNRQIGESLFVSNKTVSVHVSNILRKLGVSSRVDAAAVAQRLGVTG